MRIGFLVNPIAGMGGSVGLKGTDGEETRVEALRRGATKTAPGRATTALASAIRINLSSEWLTCSGEMGKNELDDVGIPSSVIYEPGKVSSRLDTVAAVKEFVEAKVALIVFVGGDGTARDVLEAADKSVPIIGVPAGVKMHSAVFINRPDDLGDILMTFVGSCVTKEAEVLDVNEDAFRMGLVDSKLYGIALVPDDSPHMQSGKMSYHSGTVDDEAAEIGQYIADTMDDEALYIVGPGSTTAAIAEAMGQDKTLLGTDAYMGKKRVMSDGSEKDLNHALDSARSARIIVSPIGAQGFIFGRGNQQISAKIIRRVGQKNIIIVSTPTKLRSTPSLRVDTGDKDLDEELKGKVRIVTGYKRKKLVDVI